MAAVICGLLASAAAVPAATAAMTFFPDHGGASRPAVPIRVVTAGGMPGWQITLIAAGAAVAAVLVDRALAARRSSCGPARVVITGTSGHGGTG